jgi:UPF0271 protein
VQVGAHPSFPDRESFGRKKMDLPDHELKKSVREQLQKVQNLAAAQGVKLAHIKPHGALYNQAAVDLDLADLLAAATAEFNAGLYFYGLANSAMQDACKKHQLKFIAEGFADRAYTKAGLLVPRTESGAVITDIQVMQQRALAMIQQLTVNSIDNQVVPLQLETLCLHGDHADSIQTAQVLHRALTVAGITIQAPQL